MKELNFNFVLKNIEGKEIEESNGGKLLANVLSTDTGKNPIKFWEWAKEFHAGKSISIDSSDIEILKTLIINCEQLTALSKAQLLEIINK